ncbi:HSP20-like chaperone [Trametes coccinea BRFM310]|uniref:HSP20-like chaperone n=1 Tax=Trametes coccinea (strain BRFM310) TaxID=1353009 RepID=A0A1Y2J5G5_TRAC3|nr:HSP20-like chaperone [Trametes coccinea BRFM310]
MALSNFFNDPFFVDPFADFDRLFDEAFARRTGNAGANNQLQTQNANAAPRVLRPRVDVHEDKEKNLVTATFELPGINKQNVNIDLRNNVLTVSGESKDESEKQENGYVVRERRFGRFARSLPVPEGIKPEEIKASMDNGVLTVTFPRLTPEQQPKRITVS